MATISIKSKVSDLTELELLALAKELFEQRPPENGKFDYGLLSFGTCLDITFISGKQLVKPIHIRQDGKRKSENSPINLVVEYHQSIF